MCAAQPTYVLICAGEVSGDLLGAELVREMARQRKGLQFVGVGGPAMRAAGVEMLGDIADFNGMGLLEVVGSIPRLWRLRNRIVAWAAEAKPAVAVMIDNQEFSKRVAAKLAPLGVPCVQYAAPKVWAWRQGRVHGLKKIFKHILCLFPFEAGFFTRHGMAATYLGHPVVERMGKVRSEVKGQRSKQERVLALALLPGSRKAELAHHWPVFLATWQRVKKLVPQLGGVVAVEGAEALARIKALGWDDRLTAVVGEGRFEAVAKCAAALTKSGTNNLELALLGVPAVVAYRMNWLTAAVVRRLVKVPYISPPNLILDACVYPEYVQEAATEANLGRALYPLLTDAACAKHQTDLLAKVAKALAVKVPPVEAAAGVVLDVMAKAEGVIA
ncbi:MAG: lipid-A-disaccharide synthase [Alphaproteobacteria bacterium]